MVPRAAESTEAARAHLKMEKRIVNFGRSRCFVVYSGALAMLIIAMAAGSGRADEPQGLYPAVRAYLNERQSEFGQIPAPRRQQLERLADYVQSRIEANQPARLVFVCTHNSRRSQMAQVLAAAAAGLLGVDGVETFSGGTAATALNPRAAAALRRAGLQVVAAAGADNPRYQVRYGEKIDPLTCFSKVYDSPPNPQADFCAVMTCTQADRNCPVVEGSSLRLAIPYEDPKAKDDTPGESQAYDVRAKQISREMLYVFSRLEAR